MIRKLYLLIHFKRHCALYDYFMLLLDRICEQQYYLINDLVDATHITGWITIRRPTCTYTRICKTHFLVDYVTKEFNFQFSVSNFQFSIFNFYYLFVLITDNFFNIQICLLINNYTIYSKAKFTVKLIRYVVRVEKRKFV